jgi:hypothetical protein
MINNTLHKELVKEMAKEFNKEDIDRLQLDIAGSFFMDLIGQNMTAFVKVIQKIVVPVNLEMANNLCKLHVENVTLDRRFDNALVPRARPRTDENISEVHWLFVVQNDDSKCYKQCDLDMSHFTVFNPYEKRMQVDGSQQFCQTHALYMAYKYYSGEPCLVTNPRDAYINMLEFWKLLMPNMPPTFKAKKFIGKILKPIFNMNIEAEKNKELINYVIKHFPEDIYNIYDIMTTDKAKKECPLWV